MSLEDLGKRADAGINKAKDELNEGKQVLTNLDSKEKKWLKHLGYAVLLVVVCLLIGLCSKSCNKPSNVVQSQPAGVVQIPVQPAPVVYQNNTDPMVGVLAGVAIGTMMSNGQRYDGHNGYNDSRYKGPSKTIVVNNITVNKNATPSPPNPVASPVKPSVSPAVPAAVPVNPRQAEIDAYKQKQVAAKSAPV